MRALAFTLTAATLFAAAPAFGKTDTPPVRITGDGQEQTIHCDGKPLIIIGNGNRFSLEGNCSTVSVRGNRNWLEVQDATWIETPGNLNSVLYLNPRTHVWDPGKGNSVAPKWPQ